MDFNISIVMFEAQDTKHSVIVKEIRRLGNWTRIMTNVYCVLSYTKDYKAIRDALKEYIGDDGRLFVVEITDCSWASANLPREVTSILKQY